MTLRRTLETKKPRYVYRNIRGLELDMSGHILRGGQPQSGSRASRMVVVHAIIRRECSVAHEVRGDGCPEAHHVRCTHRRRRRERRFDEMPPAHCEHNYKSHQIRYPHECLIPVQDAAAAEDDLLSRRESRCQKGYNMEGTETHSEGDETDDHNPERRIQML